MKKIFALFALFAVLAGTGVAAYSWWDQVEETDAVSLSVGEAVTMSATVSDTGGNLVPSSAILKSGDTYEVVISYDLVMDVDAGTLDLDAAYDNIEIGTGGATNSDLVNITVGGDTDITGTTTSQVTFTVTLNEPDSEAEYDDIASGNITFDVTITAVESD